MPYGDTVLGKAMRAPGMLSSGFVLTRLHGRTVCGAQSGLITECSNEAVHKIAARIRAGTMNTDGLTLIPLEHCYSNDFFMKDSRRTKQARYARLMYELRAHGWLVVGDASETPKFFAAHKATVTMRTARSRLP